MRTSKQPASTSILVADDEPAIARLIASILLTQYRVEIAGAADEAIAKLSAGSPDLLIVDVSMKGRDVLVRAMEACAPPSSVLYVSGFGFGQLRELGVDVSEANFLLKPFTMAELFGAVKRVLDTVPERHTRTRTSRPQA